MKQLNVSKKVTAPLMMWVSLLLIAITLLFGFMPLMSLDTTRASSLNEMLGEVGVDTGVEIPEKVDISAVKLISAIKVSVNLFKVTKNAVEDMAENGEDDPTKSILDVMNTKEGKETVVIAAAIASTVMNAFDFEKGIVGAIVNIFIVLIALIYVLVFVFVIPIKLIIMFIKALIPALSNIKTPEIGAPKVGNKLPKMLSIPFTMMIFQSFIPGMTYAWGLIAVTAVIIVSVLFCTVLTRLRTYEPKKFKYLNIVQCTSLVAIVGFLVFFFNILKTHVLNNFLEGNFLGQLVNIANKNVDNKAFIVDFVLIFVFAIAFLSAVKYLSSAANRLSCTVSHKKVAEKKADSNLWGAIGLSFAYIAPMLVSGWNHYEGNASFLVLNDAEKSALTLALVGIVIMILAEVALLVLKKKLCSDLAPLEASAIVCGLDQEFKAEETAPTVEETPVA